jgi:phosphohistidine phosphatase
MPTLYVLRHAKSSWDQSELEDHDRPLAPRGRRAGQRLSRYLTERRVRPSLVLCSTARRAHQTLDLLLPGIGSPEEIHLERALYGAGAGELLVRLRRLDDHDSSVLLVGHNPGLQHLAVGLARDRPADRCRSAAVTELRARFPTGALATLESTGPWGDLTWGGAHLTSLVVPRRLPD